jgi:sulfite exporter TauE/SafE
MGARDRRGSRHDLFASVPLDHTLHHAHALPTALTGADPLLLAGFAAILSYSFLASLHCAAMCGPLVCARLGPGASFKRAGIWLYNLGRALSYPAVGALAGAIGAGVKAPLAAAGDALAVAFAAALFGAALLVFAGRGAALTRAAVALVERAFGPVLRRLSPRPSAQMFALGVFTAALPCMTLTPIVLLAAGSGSALKGAASLLAFYLGTLPVMVIAPVVPGKLVRVLPQRTTRIAAGLFLLLAGLVTVVRIMH